MSWYVKAAGTPTLVAAALKEQFAHQKCLEPEETARKSAYTALLAIVNAYPHTTMVLAYGEGSQGGLGPDGTAVSRFTVRVEPLDVLL